MKKGIALVVSMSFLVTPSTFANNEGAGTIIGGIIGGLIGNSTGGKGKDNTGRTIIGGLIGALVGNRIGNDMDKKDRDAYERTSRECFDGPVGRDMNWQGNKYRGNVRSTREGYYVGREGRQVCREFHSEIYRGNSLETVDGVVCKSRNGWEKIESRQVIFDDSGRFNDGRGQNNEQSDLGFLAPISRRTGGDYLSMNIAGRNLNSITLQASGDKVRIYRVIATTINGTQVQLESSQLNTFLYLGSTATFDLLRAGGKVVRIDVLAEAWAGNLGLSVQGQSGSMAQQPVYPVRPEPAYQQIRVCDAISAENSYNGAQCVKALAGKYLDPEADRICADIASDNSYNAASCAADAAGARFSRAALQVCEAVSRGSTYDGAECVRVIANKRIDERFLQGCVTAALDSSYNGLACVQNLVIGNL